MKERSFYYNCVIQPGHLAFSREPSLIYTVCGNGLVVTLRDKLRGTGGVVHCVLPRVRSGEVPSHFHAEVALESLLRALGRSKMADSVLEAQVIGGGSFRGLNRTRAEKTARTVKRMLRSRGITIISEDIGGELGRKVIFNTSTGETVVMKTSRVRRTDWIPEIVTDGRGRRIKEEGRRSV